MSRERRRDPRTHHLFSLRNLLRISAQKFQLPLLVLGTDDDMVIAGSEESPKAQEVLLRGSRRADPDENHSELRFAVNGQTLLLVASGAPSGSASVFPGFLESVLLGAIAERVRSIFSEPAREPLPLLAPACA